MRWKCVCSYDGTDFNGWQSQLCENTIQDILEIRLAFIFGCKIRIHGSGRTDSGVHANAQVFHFDGDWKYGSDRLIAAINCNIPKSIRVKSAEEVSSDFHARFSVIQKTYSYHILAGNASPFNYRYVWSLGKRRLDVNLMNNVAMKFVGTHDFHQFGATHSDKHQENSVKTIYESQFICENNEIVFRTTGSGYLYKMVRIMVGCFVQVGLGNISGNILLDAINGEISSYNLRKECAPACGLFLDKVVYPGDAIC